MRPRARAASACSSTSTAAPSARTKPSRSRSNGREAAEGASRRRESALSRSKPADVMGSTAASVPPASTASQRQARSRSSANPSADAPDAHAVERPSDTPCRPRSMDTEAAAMFPMAFGTASGLTGRGLASASRAACSSHVPRPPHALPIRTPTRAGSQPPSPGAASATASRAAATAYCEKGSMRRASVPSSRFASNPEVAQLKSTGRPWSRASGAAVGSPAQTAFQEVMVSVPAGVTIPRPVITTSGDRCLLVCLLVLMLVCPLRVTPTAWPARRRW